MNRIRVFFITALTTYLFCSLPIILGYGYTIDWTNEATIFQKAKGYIVEGLTNLFPLKLMVSAIAGIIASVIYTIRKRYF